MTIAKTCVEKCAKTCIKTCTWAPPAAVCALLGLTGALLGCAHTCADAEADLARTADDLRPGQMQVSYSEALAQRRAHPGDVGLREALSLALRLFAEDRRDPESVAALLGAHGQHLFAHPDAQLRLLPRGSQTPRAERVAHAWIFELSLPALSDHLFYAVIGRQRDQRGQIHGYSYGFN